MAVDDLGALSRLEAFTPPPTVIIMSGGGFQAYWKLDAPLTDIDLAERYNASIAKLLGGDKCHNADRIMHVPGTINLPAKKRAAGRLPVLAKVVEAEWWRVHPLSAFELDDPGPAGPKGASANVTPCGLDTLPATGRSSLAVDHVR